MKKEKRAESVSTFLGADACLDGTIEFQGTVRLDGQVKGKIIAKGGTVIIGEKAVIKADIDVDLAIIMGAVEGSIDASQRIEAYPPARIIGNIQAPVISMDAGVVFNGRCSMKPQPPAAAKKQPKISPQESAQSAQDSPEQLTEKDKSKSK